MRRLVIAWAALVGAALANLALAFLPIGDAHMVMALAIALAMTTVMALVCMRLLTAPPLAMLFAIGGIAWFLVLLTLGGADYRTRPTFLQEQTGTARSDR